MTVQAITLNLPQAVYRQIRQAAEKVGRPVNEVLLEAVAAVAPVIGTGPENLRTALAQMAYLNDAALWQAGRATMTAEQRERLEALHDQQQREGLTAEEEAEERALLSLYRETLLVRAQAAVLLKQRGYDVSEPPIPIFQCGVSA
jgi:predicted ArsR family transcriptional regulator